MHNQPGPAAQQKVQREVKPAIPGPWGAVKSHVGWTVTRSWSSGFYQRMREGFYTLEAAQAAIDAANAKATGAAA